MSCSHEQYITLNSTEHGQHMTQNHSMLDHQDTDIKILSDDTPIVYGFHKESEFSPGQILARAKRLDFIVVYSALIILAILLLVIVFLGSETTWYRSLKQANINPWFIRGLWIVGTILSYIAFYYIWQDVRLHSIPRDLIVSVLYTVTSFLFIAWGAAFYYAEDITLSLWIAIIIFIYNLWLFIYVWNINPMASIFLIPNIILYIYLVYSSIHIASINDIPL